MIDQIPPEELRYQYKIAKLHIARQLGLQELSDKELAHLINLNRDSSMLSHVLYTPTKSKHVYTKIIEFIIHTGTGSIPAKIIKSLKEQGNIDTHGNVVAAGNWPLTLRIMEAARV